MSSQRTLRRPAAPSRDAGDRLVAAVRGRGLPRRRAPAHRTVGEPSPPPAGIEGTLTSNGGEDGSRFVEVLIRRLETLLASDGRALIYVFQFVRNGRPLIAEFIEHAILRRPVQLTVTQEKPLSFDVYLDAYAKLFPDAGARSKSGVCECRLVIRAISFSVTM